MWDDDRLKAALAALPAEAFIEGPPADGDLVWRRAARRVRAERSGTGAVADPDQIAPVIPLHRN